MQRKGEVKLMYVYCLPGLTNKLTASHFTHISPLECFVCPTLNAVYRVLLLSSLP